MAEVKGGSGLQEALSKLSASVSKKAILKVGFMGNATEPDGTPVAFAAAMAEYGKSNQPPRPFFRGAIKKNNAKWAKGLAYTLAHNGFDAEKALAVVGVVASEDVQESIRETFEPALSPVTVMLRGMRGNDTSLVVTGKTVGEAAARVKNGQTNYGASTKPLIDSGTMLNSVTFNVDT